VKEAEIETNEALCHEDSLIILKVPENLARSFFVFDPFLTRVDR
jgi:hypothetical protein